MSFADFATNNTTTGAGRRHTDNKMPHGSVALQSSKNKQAIEAASLKLEQFQRQVLAIKRASTNTNNNTLVRKNSNGTLDDDLHDRIRFACLLQEEITKALKMIPQDPANSLIQRKLCKDFGVISSQLETAVVEISAREQEIQDSLVKAQKEAHQGSIIAEHQGQVIEFAELENEIAHNEALIEEREKDIDKIHQSMAQVHEIFRDLASIVQEQQAAIDDIETHIDESLQQTQQGLNQVRKASEMQRTCAIQ